MSPAEDPDQRVLVHEVVSLADDVRAIICLSLGSFLLLFGATSYIIRGKFFLSTAVVALVFGESLAEILSHQSGIALGQKGAE